MTGAKERLVLSGALTRRQSPGSFLALLTEGIGEGVIDGFITKTVIPAGVGKPARGGRKKKDAAPLRDLKGFEARWRAREDRWARCREIGRASCRERGKISVVAVSLKKKKEHQ